MNPANHLALARPHAFQSAHDLGEDAAAVDIGHQHHRGAGMLGHAQVDEVLGHEVDLGAGAGPFHHHEVVGRAQALQGLGRLPEEPLLALVVIAGGAVAVNAAQQDHLGADLGGRLEQHGVHVDMRGQLGRLGLDDLGPPHFKPLRGHAGVVGHVLGFEGGHPHSPPDERPAQGGRDHALAYVRAGSQNGDAGSYATFLLTIHRLSVCPYVREPVHPFARGPVDQTTDFHDVLPGPYTLVNALLSRVNGPTGQRVHVYCTSPHSRGA